MTLIGKKKKTLLLVTRKKELSANCTHPKK